MKQCYDCGTDEEELRPYGPKGEWVCFTCAFTTPEAKAATENQFSSQMSAAELADERGVSVIGIEVGPIPLQSIGEQR